MNWSWPPTRSRDVLTDKAVTAEARLNAIKKAAKSLKKGVDDSLKTVKNKSEELEARKKRTSEFALGESVANNAVHVLNEERVAMSVPSNTVSPLNTVLERFANLEKTIGHMQAVNETEICNFLSSDTPISKLLTEEAPAVTASKKDLEQLCKRQMQSQNVLDKESKKLDRMRHEDGIDPESIHTQQEKKDKLLHEVDMLKKDVSLEQDRLTSNLLTLTSRENRYAYSVYELMKIKKMFYENAFRTIEAELPNIERILSETNMRPVFGEKIEDHLRSTGRTIAYPIALTVNYLLDTGLSDEGLFRISPKQIKLDKLKAHIDSHQELSELLQESDCHLHSSLLKSYLRELPVPLLGEGRLYDEWLKISAIPNPNERCRAAKELLNDETLSELIVKNIQYVLKFLHVLSTKSESNKMTPKNIAIVLGPTLLWSNKGFQTEHTNLESVISVVVTLIEMYPEIFPNDLDLRVENLAGVMLSASQSMTPNSTSPCSPLPPDIPPRPLSIPSIVTPLTTIPSTVTAVELSPNHKRKASIRAMGRNIMNMATKSPLSGSKQEED